MMSEKFKNSYRIASHRKSGWDYSSDGMYFITVVTQNRVCNLGEIVETHGRASVIDDAVETHGRASLQSQSQTFYRLPKSISSFLAGFKSAVNSKIDDYIDQHNLNIPKYNRKNHFFQPNYHDHIIRNEQSYQTISEYIIYNPAKWADDKFYTI